MPIDTASFSQIGLPGSVIAALLSLIYFLIKEHKAERREWIIAYREQSVMIDGRQVETNTVIRELVSVVREANAHHHS